MTVVRWTDPRITPDEAISLRQMLSGEGVCEAPDFSARSGRDASSKARFTKPAELARQSRQSTPEFPKDPDPCRP